MVQLSHLYMTTGKTVALTIWTFVGKMMSLVFNTLSRFVIAFLPRSSHILISWLQSPSKVILEPMKRKSVTLSTFPPSTCHEVMEPDAMTLGLSMLSFKSAFSLSSFTLMKRFFSYSWLDEGRTWRRCFCSLNKGANVGPGRSGTSLKLGTHLDFQLKVFFF